MNSEKVKKSIPIKVFEGISKVPIWAWMIILGITSAFSTFYQVGLVVNTYVNIYEIIPAKAFFPMMLIGVAVIYPFLIRLFTRIDYAIASRIYFRKTTYVPDYNLRRLPIPYNDFVRVVLFVYSVVCIVNGLLSIAKLAFPYAIYIIKLPEFLIKLLMFVFGMFMLKGFVASWQYKDVFFSLGLPTAILLAISIWAGV